MKDIAHYIDKYGPEDGPVKYDRLKRRNETWAKAPFPRLSQEWFTWKYGELHGPVRFDKYRLKGRSDLDREMSRIRGISYRKERQKHKRATKDVHYYSVHMLGRARHRAKEKGIECNITVEDCVIPSTCPVLGINIICGGPRDNQPSIDRLIPSLGYIKGNVFVCSMKANRIKNDATPDELMRVALFFTKLIDG